MPVLGNDYHSANRTPNWPGDLTVGEKKRINTFIFKWK